MMNTLDRPSVGLGNFNHWFFLEVNRRRRADALYYLKHRPREYAATVLVNLAEYFHPSTRWHPHDEEADSPHHRHRQVLGGFEAAYDRMIHGFPIAPVGLYALLPLALVWGLLRLRALIRLRTPESTRQASLLAFCLCQIAFVTVLSVLLAHGEAQRYRFKIEAFLWLIAVLALADLATRLKGRLAPAARTAAR